jgi:hypothetical protein
MSTPSGVNKSFPLFFFFFATTCTARLEHTVSRADLIALANFLELKHFFSFFLFFFQRWISKKKNGGGVEPPGPLKEKKKVYKSQEQGLNLNRSWHKATLMRTIPRSSFKSYTKDLSPPIFELVFQHQIAHILLLAKCCHNVMILARRLYVLI